MGKTHSRVGSIKPEDTKGTTVTVALPESPLEWDRSSERIGWRVRVIPRVADDTPLFDSELSPTEPHLWVRRLLGG